MSQTNKDKKPVLSPAEIKKLQADKEQQVKTKQTVKK